MSILFQPIKIKDVELKNRFVRSATFDRSDKSGHVTKGLIETYSKLAAGGVGLIVTGLTNVHPVGQVAPFQTSIADNDCIPGFKELTTVVHDKGAKIAIQLAHAGRSSHMPQTKDTNRPVLAPSFIKDDPYFDSQNYRSMNEEEILEIIEAFGNAADRARTAGFDGIQLHAAHAYLPSQFLSPFTNKRTDQWGGSLENRVRFHLEIGKAIRAKAGEDYPVLIKLGVQDGFSGGLEVDEGKEAARLLAQGEYDALEISQGLRGEFYEETEFRAKINSIESEAYFREWCKYVKQVVNVPVMLVGGLRTFELMEEIVQNGDADFISLCRPLIREPGLINEWQEGDRRRAKCISCNKCGNVLRKGEAVHCAQERGKK
ncbi:NADH:flavin oxidoreductase [Thermodesulfobacteriota bacterium]